MSEKIYSCPKCNRDGFTEAGLTRHRCMPTAFVTALRATTAPDAVVPSLPPLADLAEQANQAIAAIRTRESVFAQETLPQRLRIGLACWKAHEMFALDPSAKGKLGGRGKKSLSRRDKLSGHDSFDTWLASEVKDLKRPVAYKYIQACRGLGLKPDSQPGDIEAKLAMYAAEISHPLTLKDLVDAGASAKPEKPEKEQLTLNLVFENMRGYRLHCEQILALRHRMDKPAFDAAVARTYATLKELTGSDWAPSDDAPDAIDLDALDATGW